MPRNLSRHGFERNSPQRTEGRRVIIVCEGSKTEKGHFDAIRRTLRLTTVQVPIYHPDATNPRRVVEFAIQKRREQVAEGDWDADHKQAHAWAVYDGIEHYSHNKRDGDKALYLAKSNCIRLAITNPSFEFWYLLHFQEQNAWLEREAAYARLKENWIRTYEKERYFILIR